MTRCIACGANLVSERCPACSPEPQSGGPPSPPDRQQELAWQFFTRFGWRNAAFAAPVALVASLYVAVVDRDTGASVFLGLGALGNAVYALINWRKEHRR